MSLLSPDRPSARTSSDTAAADRAASGTAASLHFAHAMPFGACLRPEGGVRFRLWAPDAQQASVWVDDAQAADDQVIPARRLEGGWFEAEAPQVAAGACYRWRVDDKLDVPDPASRFNPEGPHGPSRVVDPMAFTWGDAERTWTGRPWHEAVMLELHVGTFTPEGTYAAAMARLPALAESGITAIQLMPLADFPGRFGWGYDGVLPYAPHEAYGEPDDLKRFVQEAHRLGLMVLLDVVYNHFGPDGNYLHAYASRFSTERHHTAWGAAINFDQPGSEVVREFFVHNALYWLLEYRFDGLRFDAVHAMLDDSRPDIMETLSRRIRETCPGRHIHLVLENDSNDVDRLGPPGTPGRFEGQWSGDFHHTLHVLLTGERDGYYAEYASPDGADRGEPLRQLAQVLTDGFAWQGGPHNSEGAAPRRRATQRAPLSATVNFLQNHDQIGNRAFGERLIRLAHPRALELATTLLLLAPARCCSSWVSLMARTRLSSISPTGAATCARPSPKAGARSSPTSRPLPMRPRASASPTLATPPRWRPAGWTGWPWPSPPPASGPGCTATCSSCATERSRRACRSYKAAAMRPRSSATRASMCAGPLPTAGWSSPAT